MAKIIKPSIRIVLLKHKVLSNGEHPAALRITFNRKSKYYVLKDDQKTITCSVHKWNQELGRFNRSREMNGYLDGYENKAKNVLTDLKDSDFTFHAFDAKYFRKNTRTQVSEFIDALVDKLKAENRLGSAASYKDTKNRLDEFKPKVSFHDIDHTFLENLEKFMKSKGNAATSIGIYMRTLRAIYNKAIVEDLVPADSYPFKKFKIKSGNSIKRALTKKDMLALIKFNAPKGSRKWHSLNYFVFSYLCRGMNFKDMALLKWDDNIIGDQIVFVRAKTANTRKTPDPSIIKIEPEIAEILGSCSGNEPYVFPILDPGLTPSAARFRIKAHLKRTNKDLQEIAKEIGLPKADGLTFYWARHTYATTLKRAGTPTAVISEALGHSSEATTKTYLDKFEQPEIDKTYKHLL